MQTMTQSHFANIPTADIPKTQMIQKHSRKMTMDVNYLYPCLIKEVLPGDNFDCSSATITRMTSCKVPIMDELVQKTFYFFVPFRLVWKNFTKMHGERENPDDSIDYVTPTIVSPETKGFEYNSIYDYMNMLPGVPGLTFSSLFLRGYNRIYNEWFRDENLQDSVKVNMEDNGDLVSDFTLLKKSKIRDYFTSCLPNAQKGNPVDLPLGTTAPVIGNGNALGLNDGSNGVYPQYLANNYSDTIKGLVVKNYNSLSPTTAPTVGTTYTADTSILQANDAVGVTKDAEKSGLIADLSNATAATINSIRYAFQLQKLLEADMRGGTRYTELLEQHFGVKNPDLRLNRTEFLGMTINNINFVPVAQNSATGATGTPQGNLAAYAVGANMDNCFKKSFGEYGFVLGLTCISSVPQYQQGIPRMYSRTGRYDYYYPVFAHLGEQEVLNKEIYADGTNDDNAVFGYQERYAEYRYDNNEICGMLRSSYTESLDNWHLAQNFSERPLLNERFITEDIPIDRAVAVLNEPAFITTINYAIDAKRPMPLYGTPGFVDHF